MSGVPVRLGLVGFGSVSRALARMLVEEGPRLRDERGVDLVVTGLTTARSGSVIDPGGIDLEQALARAGRGAAHGPAIQAAVFAATCPADVVVETLPLEPLAAAEATEVARAALQHGRSVVTANKGPAAHALRELAALAERHGVVYRYEAAVADGLPVFNLVQHALPGAGITGFTGLLNSTSNVVLDAMAAGATMADAVQHAAALGIAEADPSYDLDGWDAAMKLAALSAAVWDAPLDPSAVTREPVDATVAERARNALACGRRLVSLAELTHGDAGPSASVRLAELDTDHRFHALIGTSLGLQITSRLLCPVTVWSQQPGVRDTAYGLLADLLTLPVAGPALAGAGLLLRDTAPGDLATLYVDQLDPAATSMAAFPSRDLPTFIERWTKVLADPSVVKKTIVVEGQVAGSLVCFDQDVERLVGYWIGRHFWGRGVATAALRVFLEEVPDRPLFAHVAQHDVASLRVLVKCGFQVVREKQSDDVTELVLRLDAVGIGTT
jgi:homoserine dehydrogenase